jgi:hypothetical protein
MAAKPVEPGGNWSNEAVPVAFAGYEIYLGFATSVPL